MKILNKIINEKLYIEDEQWNLHLNKDIYEIINILDLNLQIG